MKQEENQATSLKDEKAKRKKRRRSLENLLLILIFACLVIAWWAPTRELAHRRVWTRPATQPRDAYSFIALAYMRPDGIIGSDDHQIHAHIDILTANGYTPIKLNDALQLLHRGSPVPRNAILLTVDASCRRLLHSARSAVSRYGWNAVAFFPANESRSYTVEPPRWRELRAISNSRRWDVGILGVPAPGRPHPFPNVRVAPVALAYDGGDFGQFDSPDSQRRAIMDATARQFDFAFTRGSTGRNTLYSHPHRLNRMMVKPSMSPSDFLKALKESNQAIERVEDIDTSFKATGWFPSQGQMLFNEVGMSLQTLGKTDEALAWLAGSDVRRDASIAVDFQLRAGLARFYLRASPDLSRYLVLELSAQGEAELRQKSLLHQEPVLLASTRTPVRKGSSHRISLFIRDNNINVTIDGLPLFNTHEMADGLLDAGLFGAAVASIESHAEADLLIRQLSLQTRQSTLASWQAEPEMESYVIHWIQSHGSRLTEISPPVEHLRDANLEYDYGQTSIYRHLANLYNLRLMPVVHITSERDFKEQGPVTLAGLVNDLDCDGIYVNFERFNDLATRDLEAWLRQTGRLLSGTGRPVLVRLPRVLERLSAVYSLLAVIPSVELVSTGSPSVAGFAGPTLIIEEPIPSPTESDLQALPTVALIGVEDTPPTERPIERQIRELIDSGEQAFRHGDYESAISAFFDWHQLAPSTPVPLRRTGDALSNLGFMDEALGFYRQSLNMDPSQTDLAARIALILLDAGNAAEARSLLNTFARLFPSHPDILLAQAEWLSRHQRFDEASERIERILQDDPDHFNATLFLLRTADSEPARETAIQRLMEISNSSTDHHTLIDAVRRYDLLSYQNSHLIISVMDQISRITKDPEILDMIEGLAPLTKTVSESFGEGKGLSDLWQIEGGSAVLKDGNMLFEAAPSRNEFNVRLLRSERWRDSFIEVDIGEVQGGAWLYTRRSRNHLVRFGFDIESGRLFVQVWKGRNNAIVASQNIPWRFPDHGCTLRLETRGKGVVALVDGEPVFDVPLLLPEDITLGWTAFGGEATERGKAHMKVRRIASGPLPVRIALTPTSPDSDGDREHTGRLQKQLSTLTDISPQWFSVDASGSWHSRVEEESDFYRLFARYHRLRLTPMVRIADNTVIEPEDIVTVCRTHQFDGLLFVFDTLPDAAWFDRMDRDLSAPGLDIIAIAGLDDDTTVIRGIASSRTLFEEYGATVPLTVLQDRDLKRDDDAPATLQGPALMRF